MSVNHSLRYNGAAFNADGDLINADPKVTSGSGRAACACGVLSDKLTTGAARRNWFKAHKEEAAAAVLAELDALVADAEPDTHDEPVATHRDPEATPHLLSLREDEPTGDVEMVVPFTSSVAGIFWRPLGMLGASNMLRVCHPAVQFAMNTPTKETTLSGPADEVALAAESLATLYEEAAAAYYEWKKSTTEYRDLDQATAEGRRASYRMTKGFFVDFGTKFVAGQLDDEDLI